MDLKEEIRQKLGSKAEPFAIFDFDNTCIENDIGEATLAHLCRNKLLKDDSVVAQYTGDYNEVYFKKYYDLYKSGLTKEAYILNAKMFAGFTPEDAIEVTKAAIDAEGNVAGEVELFGIKIAHGLVLRPQVIELMEFLKSLGVKIWVVSASNELAVKAALGHFGIVADLIGVRGVVVNGKITTALETPMPIIEGKVECMRKYIHPTENPILVIDDSTTGLPILETADIAAAVNRNNALTKVAREKDWYLL